MSNLTIVIFLVGFLVGAATSQNVIATEETATVVVKTALGPVSVANFTALGSIPLTPALTKQCTCSAYFTSSMKVCGTNGMNYTACQLNQAMKLNYGLGLRCNQACPCPNYAERATNAGNCSPATNTLTKKAVKARTFKVFRMVSSVYCMNDGTEETRATVFCRMAANPKLGIRVMGTCAEFASYNCPARLLQTVPMYDDTQ